MRNSGIQSQAKPQASQPQRRRRVRAPSSDGDGASGVEEEDAEVLERLRESDEGGAEG